MLRSLDFKSLTPSAPAPIAFTPSTLRLFISWPTMERKDEARDYIQYEGLGTPKHHRRERRPNCTDRWSQIVASLLVLVILLGVAANAAVWLWVTRGPQDALEEGWNHCGRSSEEAMQRGCVMEPLFYDWMPRQCVYQELSGRYPVFEDRKWYLEKELIIIANSTHKNSHGILSDLSGRTRLIRNRFGKAKI